MQCLQGIDQHARDVATLAQRSQRALIHVLEGIGFARGHRIAYAGLHIAPPAVVGAAETHEVGTPGVVARKPNRLHNRLSARHVERYFVLPGDVLETPDVVGDHRMIGAEHRTEGAHLRAAALDASLVEVIAVQIHAVRAGEVVEAIASRSVSVTPSEDCTKASGLRY